MEIRFLGPFDVLGAEQPISVGGGRQRALLAILALHADEVVPVGRLIDELWPTDPPDSALNTLQAYVSRLRKALRPANGEGEAILFEHGGYRLDVSHDAIDSHRFRALVEEGEQQARAGHAEHAASTFREALALWRGPALADFAYEPFAQAEIARLDELRLTATEARIDADLECGRHADARSRARGARQRASRTERAYAASSCSRSTARAGRATRSRSTRTHVRRSTPSSESSRRPGSASFSTRSCARTRRSVRRPPRRRSARPAEALAGAAGPWSQASLRRQFSRLPRPRSSFARRAAPPQCTSCGTRWRSWIPTTNEIVDDVVVGDYPGPVAAGGGSVWVGNIGDSTVTEIHGDTRKAEFPASAQRPVDLAVSEDALWIANATDFATQPPTGGGTVARSGLAAGGVDVTQVGPPGVPDEMSTFVASDGQQCGRRMRTTERWPSSSRRRVGFWCASRVWRAQGSVLGYGAVWVPEPEGGPRRASEHPHGARRSAHPRLGEPRRVAVGEGGVWVVTTGVHSGVWRIDPKNDETVAVIPVPPKARRVATGAGYVWVTSGRNEEEKARRAASSPRSTRGRTSIVATIPLGFRPDGVAVANDLVWVAIAPI